MSKHDEGSTPSAGARRVVTSGGLTTLPRNGICVGGSSSGGGGGLTPVSSPIDAALSGSRLGIHMRKEPFQDVHTRTLVVMDGETPSTPSRSLVKSLLVAPTEPPPPVVRSLVAHHPRSRGKRRNTFSRHSKVLKEGVLMKMKVMDRIRKGGKAWHLRFCQIRDGFFLWFQPKGPRKKPSGWVRVRDVRAVRMCDASMSLPAVDDESITRSFQVTTVQRTLYFRAKTVDDMQDWMRMLVSSKCLTPAPKKKKKSFVFPDIDAGSDAGSDTGGGGLLPRLTSHASRVSVASTVSAASDGPETTEDGEQRRLRRKHSRASHHKHRHKHRHKHKKRSRSRQASRSRSRSRSRVLGDGKDPVGDAAAEAKRADASADVGGEGKEAGASDGMSAPGGTSAPAAVTAPTAGQEGKDATAPGTTPTASADASATDTNAVAAAAGVTGAGAGAGAGAGSEGNTGEALATTAGSGQSIDDWEAHWDEENKCTVYVNKRTQETTTKLPNFEVTGSGSDGKWVKCYDYDAKREYYFHTQTGETQYDKPKGFEEDGDTQPGWGWGGWDGTMRSPSAKESKSGDNAQVDAAAPGDTEAATASVPDVEHWIECWDDNYHCPYYVNMESNVSVWERPSGPHVQITQYVDEEEGEAYVEEDVVELEDVPTMRSEAGMASMPHVGAVPASFEDDDVDDVIEEVDEDIQ